MVLKENIVFSDTLDSTTNFKHYAGPASMFYVIVVMMDAVVLFYVKVFKAEYLLIELEQQRRETVVEIEMRTIHRPSTSCA